MKQLVLTKLVNFEEMKKATEIVALHILFWRK